MVNRTLPELHLIPRDQNRGISDVGVTIPLNARAVPAVLRASDDKINATQHISNTIVMNFPHKKRTNKPHSERSERLSSVFKTCFISLSNRTAAPKRSCGSFAQGLTNRALRLFSPANFKCTADTASRNSESLPSRNIRNHNDRCD